MKLNKPARTYTQRDVIRAAWELYGIHVREPYRGARIIIDRRYNYNRELLKEFTRIIGNVDRLRADQDKARDRRKGADWPRIDEPQGVLNNHLVTDYYRHRHQLQAVRPLCLEFSGRNHWARNKRDEIILRILAKGFARYQESRKA